MQLFYRSSMPEFSKVEQYMALADKLVLLADKEELAECRRILAMNLAHYKMKYGELPQDDGMLMADLGELSEQQADLVIEGMKTLVGVLGSVIQGLAEKSGINEICRSASISQALNFPVDLLQSKRRSMSSTNIEFLVVNISKIEAIVEELPRIGSRREMKAK